MSQAVEFSIWAFHKAVSVCEYIGEAVASAIGLDDSRYQEYLDAMSEEEMRYAQAVNEERIAEDQQVEISAINISIEEGEAHVDVAST